VWRRFPVLLIGLVFLATTALGQPPDPDQLFREAVDAQQRGDFSVAVENYRELLKIQPNSVPALANLGAALSHLGRFDEAVSEYRKALKLDTGNGAIRLNLALAFYKKGDFQNASTEFEELHSANASDLQVATLLGDCYLRLGHPHQAVGVTAPLAASYPENLDLAYVAGTALIRDGRRSDGLPLVDRVAKQGNSADAYLLAGATYLGLNQFDPALEDLEAALRLNPDLPDIHTLVGIARDKVGNAQGAEPEFRKALQKNADDFRANLYLGALLYKRRDLHSARIYLEHALHLEPSSALARYEFALTEGALGQFEAAAADLQAVIHKSPDWLDPHVELAALYYKMHRTAEGAKEREIVDRLAAQQQAQGPQ